MEVQDPTLANLVTLSVLHVQLRVRTVPAVRRLSIFWVMSVMLHVHFLSILQIMPHGRVCHARHHV